MLEPKTHARKRIEQGKALNPPRKLAVSPGMKPFLLADPAGVEELRKGIYSTERFSPHLRQGEPDWESELSSLKVPKPVRARFLTELRLLWVLPFADVPAVRELLNFKFLELPRIEKKLRAKRDKQGVRLCALFVLLTKMALHGSSVFPQNPAYLAKRIQFALASDSAEVAQLEPILDLLINGSAKIQTGANFHEARDLGAIIESEHQRREGVAEHVWKAQHKFDQHRQEVLHNVEFQRDWKTLNRHFDVAKFRDSRGIIRRSPLPERNWQRPSQPPLDVTTSRFQVAFDLFCWKWFLYGMKNNEPLVEKLTFTLTPFGTQVFIPGYWSLDAARDIGWKEVIRLHRARGIGKQGEKAATNRKQRREQIRRLAAANQEAKRRGFAGAARYRFLKAQAGLAQDTDDASIRRLLRESRGAAQ